MKREIILLPSLLLASGFESLSAQDIKFLNNYRQHFDKTKYNLEEIFIITERDYELGGIMNPFNQMTISPSVFKLCKSSIQAFPYTTKVDIKELIYKEALEKILSQLKSEIIQEMEGIFNSGAAWISEAFTEKKFNHQAIENAKAFPFYQKTVALHLCGYGDLIIDSFSNIIMEYHSNEASYN